MVTPTDGGWIPERLEPVIVVFYGDLLITHADDLVTQVCSICQVHRCPDWRSAYERLSTAGELTTRAPHWSAVADLDRKPRP